MSHDAKIADLSNQYHDDRVLKSYLQRVLPADVHAAIAPDLESLGAIAANELYDLQLADRLNEPRLTQWDAAGNRIDHIELTDVWKRALVLAPEYGVIAAPYEQAHGAYSRIHQFALAHLFIPATDMAAFLMATTDGAARTISRFGSDELKATALPHLTSRSPEAFWTAGQWRTEQTGGSDLSRIQTEARYEDGQWRLYGRKWFTSSSMANMALVLAKPAPDAYDGLGLFYLPIRTEARSVNDGIRVNRLKESMGARKLPVSEIQLDGAACSPIGPPDEGGRYLTEMVEIARTWNAEIAVAYMRRGIALARDFSRSRTAFGTPIIEKPLHYDTMAGLQATYEGAFHLTFRLVELLGKREAGSLSSTEQHLLRALTPIVKLTTAKQAVEVTSEVMEAFGGAGFAEDTGIPALMRDVHALPIWEGTTNVMSLVALQTLRRNGYLQALTDELNRCAAAVTTPELKQAVDTARAAFRNAVSWLSDATKEDEQAPQAGARRFARTIGQALELALLARHAQWALQHEGGRAVAVVEHFAAQGIDRIAPRRHYDAYQLAQDRTRQTLFQM
ncbi:acyl-CoA dehydrogenase family protein [Salisaeta longa]|uniref:acyl-CoA dehydrogenase family protein n=1 Tax=Salisaeta longa TaxID=503170 RepID=UPI0003B39F07|nr:acyl-CoA dehydrogenase family protein [Salisaeta longa]